MNKTDLIKALCEKTELSTKQAHDVVEATLEILIDVMKNGDKLNILNFGSIQGKQRLPREGKNPITGEFVSIPGCKVPYFKASKALKDKINQD